MKRTPEHIVNSEWSWDSAGSELDNSAITAAALLSLARALRRIEAKLSAVSGYDVREFVRLSLAEVRAKKKRRLARKRKVAR